VGRVFVLSGDFLPAASEENQILVVGTAPSRHCANSQPTASCTAWATTISGLFETVLGASPPSVEVFDCRDVMSCSNTGFSLFKPLLALLRMNSVFDCGRFRFRDARFGRASVLQIISQAERWIQQLNPNENKNSGD
jgi:hypothetical protein